VVVLLFPRPDLLISDIFGSVCESSVSLSLRQLDVFYLPQHSASADRTPSYAPSPGALPWLGLFPLCREGEFLLVQGLRRFICSITDNRPLDRQRGRPECSVSFLGRKFLNPYLRVLPNLSCPVTKRIFSEFEEEALFSPLFEVGSAMI